MLTADDCRMKAAELTALADTSDCYADILAFDAMAREWMRLAVVAETQDALIAEVLRMFATRTASRSL
jgi:hypothetical protein